MACKYVGRFDEAEEHYTRASAIIEETLEVDQAASLYHNLGGLEHARGRFSEGEPFALRSIALREKFWGADHPAVAADIAALAALIEGQGRHEEAESLYQTSPLDFRAGLRSRTLRSRRKPWKFGGSQT